MEREFYTSPETGELWLELEEQRAGAGGEQMMVMPRALSIQPQLDQLLFCSDHLETYAETSCKCSVNSIELVRGQTLDFLSKKFKKQCKKPKSNEK